MPAPQHDSDAEALRSTLSVLGAATVGESGARRMRPRVKAAWSGARLAAPACPVRCTPGDNLAIHVAVTLAPRGSALVVDVGEEDEFGYWGEVLTTAAEAAGIAGLVIDGGVRDTQALATHGFPVFATTAALRGASKSSPGTVGAPVEVGAVVVAAGDWVIGDADGVAVVPAAAVGEVVAAAQARERKEAAMFDALRAGKTTLELLGLDPTPIEDARGTSG
jgi:4-hydroxy-4-methyl-2-oxoglutarate aldolase